jgi:hypothetical protein
MRKITPDKTPLDSNCALAWKSYCRLGSLSDMLRSPKSILSLPSATVGGFFVAADFKLQHYPIKTRAEVQVAICLCYGSPPARLVPLAGRVGALHVRRYPLATYGWLTTT